jgi:chaperonin GroES
MSLPVVASRGARSHQNPKIGGETVIRRVHAEGKTAGGIFIPDASQEKPMEGEIVAVGPGAWDEKGAIVPLDVKPGDCILFGKWSGCEIKLDGEDLLIMRD